MIKAKDPEKAKPKPPAVHRVKRARRIVAKAKPKPPRVTITPKKRRPASVIPSTHCPTCGKRLVALTPAEKQRAYRERLKAAA